MDLQQLEQIVADLLEANEQAFAVLAGAVADVVGQEKLSAALKARLARSQNASGNVARDMLLTTAVQALRAK